VVAVGAGSPAVAADAGAAVEAIVIAATAVIVAIVAWDLSLRNIPLASSVVAGD
jgi:hypothetical protein